MTEAFVVLSEEDDPTEPTDPGCPAPDCFYDRYWQDLTPVGNGWGGGRLEANIADVKLLSIPHDPAFRRLKVNIRARADGAQPSGLFFRFCLCRRIDNWPDAFLRTKDAATNGDPGTIERDVSRVARSVFTDWRYYGRLEAWLPGEASRAGYANGPVSPSWEWIED